jgi:aminopeptidase-like protein
MHALMGDLFGLCRSLTGEGVLQTLQRLQERIPLEIHEVPSGTDVFDWTVPREWNIRDAYVRDSSGTKVIDFQQSNLHVVGYSVPICETMSLEQLCPHLHTLPDYPDWIPYLTSYYNEDWGFCLTHSDFERLAEDTYEVVIDSSLADGVLRYGELCIPGRRDEEILVSTYLCHPSLANDNLSGVVLATALAEHMAAMELESTYRFLFIPETIGAITWLSRNRDRLPLIRAGLVATCVGDGGTVTYKKTRTGDAWVDRAVEKVLIDAGDAYDIRDFWPMGSDERQYCSPGINLPVGSLMRSVYGEFPEYHTSADNLDFVTADALADTFAKYLSVFHVLESDATYASLKPYCEPQLGKRGLYRAIGGQKDMKQSQAAMMWVLNFADGKHSLLDVACRSGLPFGLVREIADVLVEKGLLGDIRSCEEG